MRIRLSKDISVTSGRGKLVLLNIETGKVYGVNELGIKIWNLLKEKPEIIWIAEQIADEYSLDLEEAKTDVKKFVEELKAAGIIEYDH